MDRKSVNIEYEQIDNNNDEEVVIELKPECIEADDDDDLLSHRIATNKNHDNDEIFVEHVDSQGDSVSIDKIVEENLKRSDDEDQAIDRERKKGYKGKHKASKREMEEREMRAKSFLAETKGINQNTQRPPLKRQFDVTEREPLVFMQVDIDYYTTRDDESVLRIYGVTEEGNSVLAHIHGFRPYFYVEVPPRMNISKDDVYDIKKLFDSKMPDNNVVTQVELVSKKSIYHFQNKPSKFIKVFVKTPKHLSQLKSIIERGISYKSEQFPNCTYESHVSFVLRFMVDTDIVGMGWVQIKTSHFSVRKPREKVSH